jgi:hypothetical protein
MPDENSPPSAPVNALRMAKRKTPSVRHSVCRFFILTKLLWLSRPGDPFVHHGRHFGRTVHTMCNIHALICNGVAHMGEEPVPEESLTYELVLIFFPLSELMRAPKTQGQKRASSVPTTIADYSSPSRATHGVRSSGFLGYCRACMFYITHYSEPYSYSSQIQRGVSSARSDDTKSLKGAVLDWIFPRDGDVRNVLPMDPPPQPLSRNIKTNRGFHHPITGGLLCPAGLSYEDVK